MLRPELLNVVSMGRSLDGHLGTNYLVLGIFGKLIGLSLIGDRFTVFSKKAFDLIPRFPDLRSNASRPSLDVLACLGRWEAPKHRLSMEVFNKLGRNGRNGDFLPGIGSG